VRRQVQGRQRSRLEVAEEVEHLQAEGGEGGEGGHHRQKEAEAELSLQQGEQKL
jgi:hypothetical protein